MRHIRFFAAAALFSLLGTAAQAQQTVPTARTAPATAMPAMDMARTMQLCAQMKEDMAHHRPMGADGMRMMETCNRMNQQMQAQPAPSATLDR